MHCHFIQSVGMWHIHEQAIQLVLLILNRSLFPPEIVGTDSYNNNNNNKNDRRISIQNF